MRGGSEGWSTQTRLERPPVDEYHIALACSNLPPRYDVSAVISVVIASRASLNDLKELKLPKKGHLLRRKSSLNELRQAFRKAEPILEDYEFLELETNT